MLAHWIDCSLGPHSRILQAQPRTFRHTYQSNTYAILMEFTYAAVAANSSARRALVSSPTLPANRVVNVAMRPNLQSGDVTLYKTTMAPIRRSAARKVLNHATKELMARSEASAMPDRDRLRS
jgi:hypothetical protein